MIVCICLSLSLSLSIQCHLPSLSQGDLPEVCHEEGEQASYGHEETSPTGFLRERHPHFCRESICCWTLVHLPDKGILYTMCAVTYIWCKAVQLVCMWERVCIHLLTPRIAKVFVVGRVYFSIHVSMIAIERSQSKCMDVHHYNA